jgi:tetratricopeptide (TPR) repeat protein
LNLVSLFTAKLNAQNENTLIRKGNKLYKQKQFDLSEQQYRKAIEKAPDNPAANFNLGNTQFRKNSFEDASKSFQNTIDHAEQDNSIKESGLYNQGVALIKQKKTEESIRSWKNALKLDPYDQDARENLQKALEELKNKQPPPPPQKKDDKKDQDKKQDQQKDKNDQQNQQQQKPQSRLTQKQVDQLLKALQQRENEAQEKMNQNRVRSLSQPDKDW